MFSTLNTLFNLAISANQGISVQDKKISFLIASLGVIGHHRKRIRQWFRTQIDACTHNDLTQINLKLHGTPLSFFIRPLNEGDYLMGGELVRGGYQKPNFEPNQIIDGGSNIGMFALQVANYFPKAKLICYEPDTENYALLCKNIKLNYLSAETHCQGLWSKNITLYYHAKTSETGYVDEIPPGVPIHCVLPNIAKDCWLKLDVEGAEYEILPALFQQGQFPRWISMEIHDFNTRGSKIINLLKDNKYFVEGGENESSPCEVISAYR